MSNFKIKTHTLFIKRVFDITFSLLGILALAPIFIIIAIMVKISSKGPFLYKQIRVGKDGKLFKIYKFRSMKVDADKNNQLITIGNDNRITKIGKFIRKTKIDELPQLFNVLFGTMSFVGPRPEVQKYVNLYNEEQRIILQVKPGITDYASIMFSNENDLLGSSNDPEYTYIHEIMPKKIILNSKYLNKISIFEDIKIIILTLFKIIK